MERIELGEYIVADPHICHGQLTFKGTRILVRVVLEYVADGLDWGQIVRDYGNSFPTEAIAEAVRLAAKVVDAQPEMKLAA